MVLAAPGDRAGPTWSIARPPVYDSVPVHSMNDHLTFYEWAIGNWARASLPGAILLLLLSPFVYSGVGKEAFLVFLLLPVYMIHQYEEHAKGQFKLFVTRSMGRGTEVLGDKAIFWINILAVWFLGLVVLYLTVYVNRVFALVAGYLTAVNGLLHVIVGVVLRRYNPGFWTSLVLFLPLGIYTLWVCTLLDGAGLAQHSFAALVAVAVHAVIMINVRLRMFSVKQGNDRAR
jgi:hypothetical protein